MKQNALKYLKYSPYYASDPEMDEAAWEEFNRMFEFLPPFKKDFLVSTKTTMFIENLVSGSGLNDIQGQTLASIIRDLIVGRIAPGELPKAIEQRLAVNQETSALISAAISNKIAGRSSSKTVQPGPPLSLHEQNLGNVVDLRNKPK